MEKQKSGLNIGIRSFLAGIIILLVLMVVTYVLTFVIPGGSFERTVINGQETIVPDTYREGEGGISFIRWILSPILVLTAEGSGTIIAVIVFLEIIGGVFSCLNDCKLIKYMLGRLVYRFRNARYSMIAVIPLFFMCMGSFIGSYEECVPLVPIVVSLSVSMGWDVLLGIGMSLLAAGCGFAAGVSNPFTVGVAQELAGLKMFSGVWYRLISFCVIYLILLAFLTIYAKSLDKKNGRRTYTVEDTFVRDKGMDKALNLFIGIIGIGLLIVICSGFIPMLQDLSMPIIALTFLASGIAAPIVSGMTFKKWLKSFLLGIRDILPAILLILMASSIKYVLMEANVLDTLLYWVTKEIQGMSPVLVVLFIYAVALILNFFIASGSAKAFLLIPLIAPMADLCGISRQLCILAYVFGDGFTNVFYVTNPVLIISLGLVGISYGKWIRWSWKFQLTNLLVTAGILLLGYAVNYS